VCVESASLEPWGDDFLSCDGRLGLPPSKAMAADVLKLELRPSDASLVLAALSGRRADRDEAALETLFRRHLRMASGIAYRLLGGDDEMEDVVQESFAVAFAKLASLKDPQAFASWLASIVTATAIATIRRRRLLARLGLRSQEVFRCEALLSPHAPPDVALELRAVYEVVQGLPVDERVMLVLRRVDELTLEEIAGRTGWSIATIKRRLASAEAKLAAHRADAGARGRRS
jgi:RNA polymerase sigma-70 factor (ECF subfamily)